MTIDPVSNQTIFGVAIEVPTQQKLLTFVITSTGYIEAIGFIVEQLTDAGFPESEIGSVYVRKLGNTGDNCAVQLSSRWANRFRRCRSKSVIEMPVSLN